MHASVFTEEIAANTVEIDFNCNILARNLAPLLVGKATDEIEPEIANLRVSINNETRKVAFLLDTVENFVTWTINNNS